MSKLIKFATAIATAAVLAAPACAEVIQTSATGSHQTFSGWEQSQISSVTLAKGTWEITGLTATARTWDQGWGGECSGCHGVDMSLYYGDTRLWAYRAIGTNRTPTTQTFDLKNDAVAMTQLNDVLDLVDWSTNQTLSMRMMGVPIGWGGWALNVDNTQFSVASEVPEPASLALLGLGALGFAARRKAKRG